MAQARRQSPPPTPDALAAARSRVGYHGVAIAGQELLLKARPDVTVDLNGIAPGYTVDRIAQLIRSRGWSNVCVELGGEMLAYGESAPGIPWRAGIVAPDSEPISGSNLFWRLPLRNQAISTSGDYRNYFDKDGQRSNGNLTYRLLRRLSVNVPDTTADLEQECLNIKDSLLDRKSTRLNSSHRT